MHQPLPQQRRPPQPEFVRRWLDIINTPAPHCCHTCRYYTSDGWCEHFNARPPDAFTQTENACPHWEDETPF